MAKKNNAGKETVDFFEDLDKRALNSERFIERYAKQLVLGLVVVLLFILGYFVYEQFVISPRNQEATSKFLTAQTNMVRGNDSLALGGKSAMNPGLLGIYEEYSGTKIGKLSAYNAAVIEFKNENYQKAYDLMNKFSSSNKIFMALKHGFMGDCLANLDKGDDAILHFDKAISASKDDYTSYYFTRKAGLLAIAIKKNTLAKKYFSIIDEKYREHDFGYSDAYIEMVKYW